MIWFRKKCCFVCVCLLLVFLFVCGGFLVVLVGWFAFPLYILGTLLWLAVAHWNQWVFHMAHMFSILEASARFPFASPGHGGFSWAFCSLMRAECDFQVCIVNLFKSEVKKADSCSWGGLYFWETFYCNEYKPVNTQCSWISDATGCAVRLLGLKHYPTSHI